jgi:hypothetical protein
VVKTDAGAQVVLNRNVIWEHWEHPTKSKFTSQLEPEKKTMLENIVTEYLTKSKSTNGFNNINLRGG